MALTRRGINFIPGSEVTITTVDNPTLNAVDVTIGVSTSFVRKDTLTAKGDIYAATASATIARLGVGINGTVLKAASGQTTGLKWEAVADSEVTFTDITTNNASSANHGFLKKLSAVASEILNGAGNWVGIATLAVSSLCKSGSTPLVGAVTLSGGSGVTLTQTGQDIAIAATGGGTGSAFVATDTIWDAKGDLAAGTGADAASRLPVGTDGQFLTAASGQTTGLLWASIDGGSA